MIAFRLEGRGKIAGWRQRATGAVHETPSMLAETHRAKPVWASVLVLCLFPCEHSERKTKERGKWKESERSCGRLLPKGCATTFTPGLISGMCRTNG